VTRRSDATLTIGVLITVAVFGLAGITVLSRGHSGPSYPSEWDPRVLDIVQFDEQHRGLKFEHPVYVDFLDPQAYSQRARTDQSELTDKEKHQLEVENGELRALGLSNSNIDLLQAENDLQDTGTLAFYDPDSQHVIVRGTEMTVALKVTLVHEFVHVLQDQHFGVGQERTNQFTTSQEASSFRALVEGDAVRIENEFIMSLSDADRQAYQTTHSKEVDNATAGLSNVPIALQALQTAPYLFGPPFDELLIAKGQQAELDAAFKDPPTTDEHLLDPPRFENKEKALDVKEPPLPDGVSSKDKVDNGDFGALGLLLVLGERIDPLNALRASDGWGGDAYVAYQQNGKTCVHIDMRGDTETDMNELRNAFDQWAKAMPAGAASVTSDGDIIQLQTCDPGANSDLTLNNRANDLVQMPAARSEFMLEAVQQLNYSFDKAFTFGDCVVRALGFDTFVEADKAGGTGPPPELQQKVQSAITTCR
jgi:hypothetical protein